MSYITVEPNTYRWFSNDWLSRLYGRESFINPDTMKEIARDITEAYLENMNHTPDTSWGEAEYPEPDWDEILCKTCMELGTDGHYDEVKEILSEIKESNWYHSLIFNLRYE